MGLIPGFGKHKGSRPATGQWKGTVPPDPGNPLEWPWPFWPKEPPRPGRPEEQTDETRPGYTGRLDGDNLSTDQVDEFLAGKAAIIADSTNVFSFRFRPETRQLEVTFLGADKRSPGATYLYSEISRDEAMRMAGAYSKGKFVHNFLKASGKPYMRIS